MNERMQELAWIFLDDGTVHLEQSLGNGEYALVNLHPAQLRYLCEQAGLLKPIPINLAEHLTTGHLRRLRSLFDRIQELRDCDAFFNDLFDRCHDGVEWWQHIRAIYEQAEELVVDCEDRSSERNGSASQVSVTSERDKMKPKRPPSENALTKVERQALPSEKKGQQMTLT